MPGGIKGNFHSGPLDSLHGDPTLGIGSIESPTFARTAPHSSRSSGSEDTVGPTPPAGSIPAGPTPGPNPASAPPTGSAGAPSATLPSSTHNGALGIQQPANAVWGIGALLAWAIMPWDSSEERGSSNPLGNHVFFCYRLGNKQHNKKIKSKKTPPCS